MSAANSRLLRTNIKQEYERANSDDEDTPDDEPGSPRRVIRRERYPRLRTYVPNQVGMVDNVSTATRPRPPVRRTLRGVHGPIVQDVLPDQTHVLSRDEKATKLLGKSSYYRKRDRTVQIRFDEDSKIDHDLLKLRQGFRREELPALWDVPLDWKTGGAGAIRKGVHPLFPGGGDANNYDEKEIRDDDDAWDRLLYNEETHDARKKRQEKSEQITFESDDLNAKASTSMFDEREPAKEFMDALPPTDSTAPFIDVPTLHGVTIPEDQYSIPIPRLWQDIVTPSGNEVKVKLFDFSLCRPDYTLVNMGKRRSGKTQFTRNYMKAFRPYFPEVYVFTGTKVDIEYDQFVPSKYIFRGYNDTTIEAILYRQEQRQTNMRKRGVNDQNINVLLVLDDCITDNVLRYSLTVRTLFFNGRHLYISVLINSQDIKGIGPALRGNIDMAVLFPVRAQRDKQAARENFIDFVRNDTEFDEVQAIIQKTPYTILFVDQSRPYMPAPECVYAGIAAPDDKLGAFFMGTREFWRGSEEQARLYEGADSWLERDDWGMVKETYKLKMQELPKDVKMSLDELKRNKRKRYVTKHPSHNASDPESSSSSEEEER